MARTTDATPSPIDGVLAALPDDQRRALQGLREAIAAAAPDAIEAMSYGAPAFRYRDHPLVSFNAAKHHCAFYVMSPDGHHGPRGGLAGFRHDQGSDPVHARRAAPGRAGRETGPRPHGRDRRALGLRPRVLGTDGARLRRLLTTELTPEEITAIRDVLWTAFGSEGEEERFSEDDWQHGLGGLHFVLDVDGVIVGHASVVERELHVDGQPGPDGLRRGGRRGPG